MGYLVVYGAGFLLPQVGGFQVGQMQLDGDGVFIVGHAYGKIPAPRSEERRVGKECRSRWSPYH